MPEPYSLVVQDALQERQLRRLGAAVSLLWERMPQSVKDDLILQASMIHISGESAKPGQIEDQLTDFLESRTVSTA